MVFTSSARLTALYCIVALIAVPWTGGSGPDGLLHGLERRIGPITLDRLVDGRFAVYLLGPEEMEFIVPIPGEAPPVLPRDDEALARAGTKLEQLRERGGQTDPVAQE